MRPRGYRLPERSERYDALRRNWCVFNAPYAFGTFRVRFKRTLQSPLFFVGCVADAPFFVLVCSQLTLRTISLLYNVPMPDKVLTCQNCQSPFVYSEYEQTRDAKESKNTPLYCPICTSIKQREAAHPPIPPMAK